MNGHFKKNEQRGTYRNVRDLTDRINHGLLPGRLWIGAIAHQIKSIGNGIGNFGLFQSFWIQSLSRSFGRTEFRLIRIGRFMQINMAHPLLHAESVEVRNERSRFFRGRFRVKRSTFDDFAFGIKGPIGIDFW
jgi:hypothetical protein